MGRGFVRQQKTRENVRADVKSGSDIASRHGYRRVDKKGASDIGGGREQMSPFFGSTMVLQQPRITHSLRSMEEGARKETEKAQCTLAHSLIRSRSYGGNFQASGFPGNLWRGHSLDRHEQCSPSFIRPCYRSGPFGPAGVTRVIRERCIHARERACLVRWDITSLTRTTTISSSGQCVYCTRGRP